jgi:hypothetical protein
MALERLTKDNFVDHPPFFPVYDYWYNELVDAFNAIVPTAGTAQADTINEVTAGSGVTIDGVLLKDGIVLADDGAAATPSISFADYDDMGLYVSSATELGFATGGAFVARLSQLRGLEINQVYSVRYLRSQAAPVNSDTDPADKAVMASSFLAGLLTGSPAAPINYTLPTGTQMDTACAGHVGIDESFDFNIINLGAGTITFLAAAAFTIVGIAVVAGTSSASFRVRKTAANTFVLYRIA